LCLDWILQKDFTVQELNLSDNNIGPEGAQDLEILLGENQNIRKLVSLSACACITVIPVNGNLFNKICYCLQDISENTCGLAGTIALGEIIRHNDMLREIRASGNPCFCRQCVCLWVCVCVLALALYDLHQSWHRFRMWFSREGCFLYRWRLTGKWTTTVDTIGWSYLLYWANVWCLLENIISRIDEIEFSVIEYLFIFDNVWFLC